MYQIKQSQVPKAIELYYQAQERGSTAAIIQLAHIHLQSTPKDTKQAFDLLYQAASLGDHHAMTLLGMLFPSFSF